MLDMPVIACRDLPTTPVAAFNVITLEHVEGVIAGAEAAAKPVILQLSQNAVRFHEGPDAIAATMHAVAASSKAPVVLHLDHVTDADLARSAVDLGFTSVMYDGSSLDFDANVRATREMARWCHANDLWLEAELGEVGGKDGAHAPGVRTDPVEAARFVADTDVDALAVAVGSSHAMTDKTAALDLDLIARLREAVPVPLVLHGSSGVPDATISEATRRGIWKVNIGTALNVAFTGEVRSWLNENGGVDPRKYLASARASIADTVAHYLQVIGDPDSES
jgi:fructose-bisphosphate aldolase class II